MMSFLDLIQNNLCHPESIQLVPGPTLLCNLCNNSLNIYEYITRDTGDDFLSSALAQAYYEWTRDENVPMNFTVFKLEGIFPKTVFKQSLNRIRKSLNLLKALNAPFTTRPYVEYSQDMNTFLKDFLNIISEYPNTESNDIRTMLETLLRAMHDMLSSEGVVNPFESYFDIVVPFVQSCFTQWEPLKLNESYPNVAVELSIHLKISDALRQAFGKFSLAFDVIHVMVCCFAFSVDMEVVGNWVLDLMARVCRGRYFWKNYPQCHFVERMNQLIQNEIDFKTPKYYYVLKAMRNGESVKSYSEILIPFYDMQMHLRKKYCTDKISETGFVQTFPAVCFQDHGDSLGFSMGFNYLMQTISRNNNREEKGMYKKAAKIHHAVKKFVCKIQEFEQASSSEFFWTIDSFKLFLACDDDYASEIRNMMETLLESN